MIASREGKAPTYRGRSRVRLLDFEVLPHQMFASLARQPGAMFLDSALIDRYGLGRWSFIVYDPLLIVSSRGDTSAYRIGKRTKWEGADFFRTLRRSLGLFTVEGDPSWIPFRGGAVGFMAYELGRRIERMPETVDDDLGLPESFFGFYDTVLAYDHIMEQWFLCHIDFRLKRPDFEARLREVKIMVARARQPKPAPPALQVGPLRSNFKPEDYLHAVSRAKAYISLGDIYQVNLSQRFAASLAGGNAWDLYLKLRETNPAPFAAFVQAGQFQLLSSSPERFLNVKNDHVETRPIKGTRPRGASPREDAWYRAQLLASEKDRAELNMIVDLERNDLGRVCQYGSIAVTRHAQCETYARVHHLVSTVEGKLRPEADVTDLLQATFPGGSITGAPKIRSMQIIDELEPCVRNAYTGAIGYLGYDGDLDLNIAIRTMIINGSRVYFSAGGGIVADSDPQLEFDETVDKARALIDALGGKFGAF
jgi:para-aminobenzoate synthetase component I